MTPNRKGKEKILIDEESETKEEEDIDATLEEAIKRAARIKEAKRSLKEIIASITTKQPATTTFSPATTKKTPTKSLVSTLGPSNKRKWAQPSRGATAMRAPEETKPEKTKRKCLLFDL